MRNNQSETLTKASLGARLKGLGYARISEPTVKNWRKKGVLPEFDLKSRKLGRGQGSLPCAWTQSETVLNQAAWAHKLLRMYKNIDSIHLPLWMLGYSVPLRLVKKSLESPVEEISRSIHDGMKREEDLGGDLAFEDFLDQVVYEAFQTFWPGGLGAHTSQAMLRVFYNLIFNPEYDLNDEPFRRMVEAFKIREARRGNRSRNLDEDNAANIFGFAAFIKEHLSFDAMTNALRHCTDDDLRVVERDLEVIREILSHLGRMFKAFFSAAPAEYTTRLADFWPALFALGRLCVLSDLSLRRGGYGAWIDAQLPNLLNRVRAECNETREAEIRAAGAEFVSSTLAKTEERARQRAADAETAAPRVRAKRSPRPRRRRRRTPETE